MQRQAAIPVSERLLFVVLALAASVWLALVPESMSPQAQLIILAVLVAFLGMPHGALDPWIAQQIGWCGTFRQSLLFNAGYLAIAGAVVLLWLWLPVASLLVFLLISAWHFSEDWLHELPKAARLAAGGLLLLMPIGFHLERVAEIFAHLSGPGGAVLAHQLAIMPWGLAALMGAVIALALWRGSWFCALELACLLVLAWVCDPLIYFIIYFCALHSPRHLLGLFASANQTVRPKLIRMTVIYTSATLLLLAALWMVWPPMAADSKILQLVFIGLAAVTVPHMMLIAWARYASAQGAKP